MAGKRHGAVYAAQAGAVMIVLFAARWAILARDPWFFAVRDAVFVIPVVALLLVARTPWPERRSYILALLAVYILGDGIAILSGVQELAETGGSLSDDVGAAVAVAGFHAIRVGVPTAVLIAFIGDDPARLWKRPKKSGRTRSRGGRKRR